VNSCIQHHSKERFSISSKGKHVRFMNSRKLDVSEAIVDGCLIIEDDRRKCDYYVRTEDKIWLIELKGKAFEHAFSQIAETTTHLRNHIKNRECIPVIVTLGRTPARATLFQITHVRENLSKMQRELQSCKGRLSKNPIIKTRQANISIS